MTFEELDLDPKLLQAIQDAEFTACTPVQEQTFVYSLIGTDVAVQSQTGTGKTAAFLITIFQLFLEQRSLDDRIALIVAPTRELADQIEKDARQLGKYLDFTIASFYGGVGYEKQERALASGLRVAIGTPGRLLDFAKQRKLDLQRVGILVIDEADRLFDMGFIPDLRRLIRQMPGRDERITMLYSATLSTRVKSLAWEYMNNPAEISVTPEQLTVDEISQELYHVARERKFSLLLGVLARDQPRNALIFTNTKQVAYEVATRMQRNGHGCEYIIGDLPQSKRQRLIDDLKSGDLQYLVATDVAARGLHVEELDLVVNYDLPEYSENYVHRIGRTARAGRTGKAVALACEEYVFALEGIEEFVRTSIPTVTATADMYVEDATAGVRLGHYLGPRSRDDRGSRGGGRPAPRSPAGSRSGERRAPAGAGATAGSGERRAPAVTGAAAARNGHSSGGRPAVAARERTSGARDTQRSGRSAPRTPRPAEAPVAGAPTGSGSAPTERRPEALSDAPREAAAGRRSDGEAARPAASTRGGRGQRAGVSTSGAGATRSRRGGTGDQPQGREPGAPGRGPARSQTPEQRLAHYREKYGEDFKLVKGQTPAKPVSQTEGSSTTDDQQPVTGLRRLLPRIFRRRIRSARQPSA